MRTIYFLRHCMPDFPEGKRLFLGNRTDLPLSSEGRKNASRLSKCFVGMPLEKIFTSPMRRCAETAELVSCCRFPVEVLSGTEELDCGAFDGLDFEDIQKRFPDVLKKRALDPSFPPPEGESYSSGAKRLGSRLSEALSETSGDILVVCHGALLNAFLCFLPGYSAEKRKPSYGTVSAVGFEQGAYSVLFSGINPESFPPENSEEIYWEAFKTPHNVREHCRAVLKVSLELYNELEKSGVTLDPVLIKNAALFHDLHRAEHEHANKTADYFCKTGFLRLGNAIRLHHGGFDYDEFDEAKLVYLADKYVSGTKRVSLDLRFSGSLAKCNRPEALEAHEKRFFEAKEIEKEYMNLIFEREKK